MRRRATRRRLFGQREDSMERLVMIFHILTSESSAGSDCSVDCRRRYWPFALAVALAILQLQTCLAAAPSRPPDTSVEYATQLTPIYSDVSLAHQIGTLSPGSELHLKGGVAASGGRSFSVDGWFQEGNRTSFFLNQGKRIVIATLTEPPTDEAKLSEQKDDYGNTWIHARIGAYVAPTTLADDQSVVWESAVKLYHTRCSACHAVHNPKEFTANQWPGILKIMAKNAALQPAELALLTEYLQTHAKP